MSNQLEALREMTTVVADTGDYLELLVHLRLDQIHGLAEFQAKSMSQ